MWTSNTAKSDSETRIGSEVGSIHLEKTACPKCGADDSVILFQGKDYLYHVEGTFFASKCQNCGFWFENPRPVLKDMAKIYPEDYLPHAKPSSCPTPIRWGRIKYLQRHLGYEHLRCAGRQGHDWTSLLPNRLWKWHIGVKLIPRYVPGGKLIEIGCASGTQLLFFRQLGWEHLYGVELVPEAAEIAQALGFSVKCGPIETILDSYPDEYFDVVFSTMVLEHMYDPFRVVREIARKLKPNGQFLFSTVTRDSLDVRMYGSYSRCFDFPRHLIYFQKRDIYEMLEEKFEQIECFHQAAPQDFVWPATWRLKYGKAKSIDWIILALDRSFPALAINMFLAWLGLTLRVSFRCYRKA